MAPAGVLPAAPDDGATNTALKRIPLTLQVHKDFDYFADFISEFGPHIYPEGMFIPTPRPKTKGALVRVDFKTSDGFQILHATCEVVRCDEALPGMLSGMWVSFRVIDEASRDLVRKIYAERETSTDGQKPDEVRGDVPKVSPSRDEDGKS